MSAPRTPADVVGTWSELAQDIDRRQDALNKHAHGSPLPVEEVAEHAIAMLAQARYLAVSADAHVVSWALAAVRAGAPMPEVAAACEQEVARLRVELLARVDIEERMYQRPNARFGLDPVQAEQVRALITGADR